jgi:general secretion pathway protein G
MFPTKFMRPALRGTSGMSLLEIMVVLTIMGMVIGVIAVNVTGKLKEGKYKAAEFQIAAFQTALDDFYRDNSFYPFTIQGLQALVEKPSEGREAKNWRQYLKEIPKDPWDTPYQYTCENGQHYEIKSLAQDTAEGGEEFNKDIVKSN